MSDPKSPKAPTDFRPFRIVGLVLREPVAFGARDAKRFYLAGSEGASKVAGGVHMQGADAIVSEFAWCSYGQSLCIAGALKGSGAVEFVIVVSIGPGDRVLLAPPLPPVVEVVEDPKPPKRAA